MPLELTRTPEHARRHVTRNLRSNSADDQVRDRVRLVTGPKQSAPSHYSADRFSRFASGAGAVHDVYGRRLLRVTANFLQALTATLSREDPDAAAGVMYRIGLGWGTADFRAFVERIQQEYEAQFDKLGMGLMLESWSWPLRACGWGTWRFDLRNARSGLIFIDVTESPVAAALGRADQYACHLLAGLFAAAFGHLAGRELVGVETQCACKGEGPCRFLVAASKRAKAAIAWRDEGIAHNQLVQNLVNMTSG